MENMFKFDRTNGLVSISVEHSEIHDGHYWFADDVSASLSSGDIKYWLLITPDGAEAFHSLPQFIATGEFELQSYEAPTTTANGTEIVMQNRNRIVGGTTPIKFYKDPTGVNLSGATLLRNIRVGSGTGAVGEIRSESEIVAKPGTKYVFVTTSRSSSNFISCHMNGYTCECS